MTLSDRITAFSKLGNFLQEFTSISPQYTPGEGILATSEYFDTMIRCIEATVHHNGWFTKDNVRFSLAQWSTALSSKQLEHWVSPYNLMDTTPLTIGVILAGNIPLVGFHDVLSILISGHRALIKPSSNDDQLLPHLLDCLIAIVPEFQNRITITKEKLTNYDAIIATGSNNTARYFEHYFKHVPHIIRKNRNSVAILTGEETPEELYQLGIDIFQYYGLGCRSVSKLFVPKGYDFDHFFKGIYPHHAIMDSDKYANNYDYNKAVYLMSNFKILDNGFLILKEDAQYTSPIATLFYETYENLSSLEQQLEADREKIQCIVGQSFDNSSVKYGQTQCPQLSDYADGVDTLTFLTQLIQ